MRRSRRPGRWGALLNYVGSILNYVGSIFFMLSAIASSTLETTGESLNITVVNVGTFLGAVCFFVGAYLLLPAVDGDRAPTAG